MCVAWGCHRCVFAFIQSLSQIPLSAGFCLLPRAIVSGASTLINEPLTFASICRDAWKVNVSMLGDGAHAADTPSNLDKVGQPVCAVASLVKDSGRLVATLAEEVGPDGQTAPAGYLDPPGGFFHAGSYQVKVGWHLQVRVMRQRRLAALR